MRMAHGSITGSKHYPRRVSKTYLDVASDLGLEQMVDFPTRGDNTLDLIFTSHPSYQERCKPLPPISAKSDHDIVLFDSAHQPVRARPKRRTIYLWKKADTEGIVKFLTAYSEFFSARHLPQSTVCGKTSKQRLTKQSRIMSRLRGLRPDILIHGRILDCGELQGVRTEHSIRQNRPRVLSIGTDTSA